MNNAEYALPGCMPPDPINMESVIKTPEDGSLKLCVAVASPQAKVSYAITLPGCPGIIIRDPLYYAYHMCSAEEILKHNTTRSYMRSYTTLPREIPSVKTRVRIYGAHMLPITELEYNFPRTYYVLELPMNTLPYGDAKLEILVEDIPQAAGTFKTDYVLRCPYYGIKTRCYKEASGKPFLAVQNKVIPITTQLMNYTASVQTDSLPDLYKYLVLNNMVGYYSKQILNGKSGTGPVADMRRKEDTLNWNFVTSKTHEAGKGTYECGIVYKDTKIPLIKGNLEYKA